MKTYIRRKIATTIMCEVAHPSATAYAYLLPAAHKGLSRNLEARPAVSMGRKGFHSGQSRIAERCSSSISSRKQRNSVDVIVDGDRLVSNNHARTALMHALTLSLRMKTPGRMFLNPL
jgi:hypothetical protein